MKKGFIQSAVVGLVFKVRSRRYLDESFYYSFLIWTGGLFICHFQQCTSIGSLSVNISL